MVLDIEPPASVRYARGQRARTRDASRILAPTHSPTLWDPLRSGLVQLVQTTNDRVGTIVNGQNLVGPCLLGRVPVRGSAPGLHQPRFKLGLGYLHVPQIHPFEIIVATHGVTIRHSKVHTASESPAGRCKDSGGTRSTYATRAVGRWSTMSSRRSTSGNVMAGLAVPTRPTVWRHWRGHRRSRGAQNVRLGYADLAGIMPDRRIRYRRIPRYRTTHAVVGFADVTRQRFRNGSSALDLIVEHTPPAGLACRGLATVVGSCSVGSSAGGSYPWHVSRLYAHRGCALGFALAAGIGGMSSAGESSTVPPDT